MDLRAYYAKIREVADSLESDYAVVVSLETPDGGKAGIKTEVHKSLAARLIVDDKAVLATESEREEYYSEQRAAAEQAAGEAESGRVHFTVISEADLKTLRKRLSGSEE
jgi:hypothetical protein